MKMQITKSIQIEKNAQSIFDIISDLNHWNQWSPWYQCEPTAKTTVVGPAKLSGQLLTWSGEVIGSGKMTLEKLDANKSISFVLEFLTPWKSKAEVVFELNEAGKNKTEVIWNMNSSLPFFMFFFKNMMAAYIGADFSRGLGMLKELAETGQVISKSVYQGEKQFPQMFVLGKRTACSISEISKYVPKDFQNLDSLLKSGKVKTPDMMTTLSHVHDIPKGVCEFTAGYVYNSREGIIIPDGYAVLEIDQHKALLVDHYGSYRNIVNPWAMAITYQRSLKKKLSKNVPPYEIYRTMPGSCAEKDIHTQVIMPIR